MAWIPAAIAAGTSIYSAIAGNKGKEGKIKQTSTRTPEQKQHLNEVLSYLHQANPQAFSYLQQILSDQPGAFEDYEAPYQQMFSEEVIPGITERFAGMGATSSSGLNQSLASAGRKLTTDLAAQRANLKSQAVQGLFNFNQLGQQSAVQPYYQQGTPSTFSQVAPYATQIGMSYLNNMNNNSNAAASANGGYKYPGTQQYDLGFRSGAIT